MEIIYWYVIIVVLFILNSILVVKEVDVFWMFEVVISFFFYYFILKVLFVLLIKKNFYKCYNWYIYINKRLKIYYILKDKGMVWFILVLISYKCMMINVSG